jgi:hypothetical protein
MAVYVKREYPCSQKDLYSVLETAWTNYANKQADFSNHKGMYTLSYGTTAMAAVTAAKAMPDEQARSTEAEMLRTVVVGRGKTCLKNFQKLKSYIETAFPDREHWNIQFEGAGQSYYAGASNEEWESMEAMNQSGKNYIAANAALLAGVPAGSNMPATFAAAFTADADGFTTKYLEFKVAEETSEDTAAKITANNEVYRKGMDMMRDGQVIYMDNLEVRKLFVFNTLLELINPPANGVKGSVKATVTNEPLAGAKVKTQKTGEVAVETIADVEGKYSKMLSAGEYTITANADGYETQSVTITLNSTGFKTFDFVMEPA